LLLPLLLALACVACVQHGRPPVADRSPVFGERPQQYLVQRGDTLYSIAWRFGLDHRRLALANGVRPPYTIYPGQRLRLSVSATPGAPSDSPRASAPGKAQPTPRAGTAPAPDASAPPPSMQGQAINWQWPTKAPVGRGFGRGNNGIDFSLQPGLPVLSAGSGDVVYAGKGLGGYRYLVIVKHSEVFLSAYSLNRGIRVKEGQRIKAGAVIADTQSTGRTAGKLHFEIRKDGEPVNPASVIRG
jgi:lipoprotein NlpD